MELLDKVQTRSFICGIELSFDAQVVPSAIEGWQPFYNSTFTSNDFEKAYGSKSSFDFGEETVNGPQGTSYKQKAVFRFPVTDHKRAERIALLQQVKFVKFKLSTGLDIVIGRNDFFQNTKPEVKVKTNEHLAEVEILAQSIFPSGFTPNLNIYGLPTYVPVTLV
jgi:hypothetical protein